MIGGNLSKLKRRSATPRPNGGGGIESGSAREEGQDNLR